MLSRAQARAFYDRFGAKQDSQGFYEDPATRHLLAHADFGAAERVFEFGCGTGRFAAALLAEHLPATARYTGCDLSATMVGLARDRLRPFGERAAVLHTDGAPALPVADGSTDRFVSNYVVDLLPPAEIAALLREAHRALSASGRLCLASLTHGTTPLSRAVAWAWARAHRLRPSLVGGCRPIELLDFLPADDWEVTHRSVVVAFGVPSEVAVARPRPHAVRAQ